MHATPQLHCYTSQLISCPATTTPAAVPPHLRRKVYQQLLVLQCLLNLGVSVQRHARHACQRLHRMQRNPASCADAAIFFLPSCSLLLLLLLL
jgi:hypothetical protein